MSKTKKIRLDKDTRNWIIDRIENNESLMQSEFIYFMKDLGRTSASIKKYKSKEYIKQVKKSYNKIKKRSG